MESKLDLTDEQREYLSEMIRTKGLAVYNREIAAKEELADLGEEAQEAFGMKKAVFMKIVKVLYKESIEEETEKALYFKQLYEEALGE